ncbi:MAG: dTDP-4-dehydrorhamnose reductase [Nitrososphaerales archaeon]
MANKKTLLLIGVSGLTGYKLGKRAGSKYSLYGTYNYRSLMLDSCELSKLDITKEEEAANFIGLVKPDLVVNTAALHNVDYCETHREEAFKINVDAVRNLALIVNKIGARLIHISTDFVFDGRKGHYTENDKPSPLSYYALTKLEGEKAAQEAISYAVIRPSVVYGWTPLETAQTKSSSGKPMNFGLWCVTKLSKKEEIKALTDQYTSPTLADNLADVIIALAESEMNGTYHASGLSCLNRYDFVRKLAEVMGFSPSLVKPITSDQFAQIAPRPKNSCLDCGKVAKELDTKLLTAEESLEIMKEQIKLESPNLLSGID